MNGNLYEAPKAWGADPSQIGAEGFSTIPRRRPAGAALQWLSDAWQTFMHSPGLWIGVMLAFMLVSVIGQLVPIVGPLAMNLLTPVLLGGLMLGCHEIAGGGTLELAHLWAGFQRNFGQLLALAAINFGVSVVIVLVVVAAFVAGVAGSGLPQGSELTPDAIMDLALPALLALLLILPLSMANWFAVALIAINGVPAIDAMKASFSGCLVNLAPFTLYGVLGLLIAIVASVPLALGWLVAAPVLFASSYASYRDVFYAEEAH